MITRDQAVGLRARRRPSSAFGDPHCTCSVTWRSTTRSATLLKAIFFDIDGTLIDSNELHVDAWAHAFSHCGVPVARHAIRKQVGKGADMLIPSLLPALSSELCNAADRYKELLGVTSLVLSTCADDDEHSKPAADIFASALSKVDPIFAEECLAIGDTPYDAEAAEKCGVRTLAVRTGAFSDHELRTGSAIMIKDSVLNVAADLDAILDELTQANRGRDARM